MKRGWGLGLADLFELLRVKALSDGLERESRLFLIEGDFNEGIFVEIRHEG